MRQAIDGHPTPGALCPTGSPADWRPLTMYIIESVLKVGIGNEVGVSFRELADLSCWPAVKPPHFGGVEDNASNRRVGRETKFMMSAGRPTTHTTGAHL